MKEKIKRIANEYLQFSVKSWLIFTLIILVASLVCLLLMNVTDSDFHVPLIFVLATFIVAITTEGYFYGIFSAVISVFAVNWAFTYPYMAFDFVRYGYPITFIVMLTVGFATSTLASRLKVHEKNSVEAEKEKMRANLLRSISHDLRTPLTSISGAVEAVIENDEKQGDLTQEQCIELLKDVKKDADWLRTMVENILSITRMSADSASSIKKSDEILEEVLSAPVMKFKKKHPGVAVEVIMPDEPIFVPVDPILIEQLMLNILDNAVSHGKTTRNIVLTVMAPEDGYVEIGVENDGAAIDSDKLQHLFDGSLQSFGQGSDKSKFIGIGLAVCKTIVDAHGGRIWAENPRSGGARFCFTLSLKKQEYSDADQR